MMFTTMISVHFVHAAPSMSDQMATQLPHQAVDNLADQMAIQLPHQTADNLPAGTHDHVDPGGHERERGCLAFSTEVYLTPAVFADIHDGDQKQVTVDNSTACGPTLEITPFGNDENWSISSKLDLTHCNATIDFNVPGKPNPPPVNLTATIWLEYRAADDPQVNPSVWAPTRYTLAFTDPTGTLAGPEYPLNFWVQSGPK